MIAVIDATGNNLTSLVNSIDRLGFDCVLTHDPVVIKQASHVILPGVGSAASAMQALRDCELINLFSQLTQPLLGICLGMQLLFEHSEEGDIACLGLLDGLVQRIPIKEGYPVPHMGWNQLEWCCESLLRLGIDDKSSFYFVHSYAVTQSKYTVASCQYSMSVSAIVRKNNIYGMQFHPEKSGELGLALLNNFLTREG